MKLKQLKLVIFLCGLLVLISSNISTATQKANKDSTSIEVLISRIKIELGKSVGKGDSARAEQIKYNLEELRNKIRAYQNSVTTSELNVVISSILIGVEKRINKCESIIKNQWPPDQSTQKKIEENNLNDAIKLLKDYIADTTKSVFVDTTKSRDLFIKQEFLKELASALMVIAEDTSSIKRASSVLTDLFIIKQAEVRQWINFLRKNSDAARKFGTFISEYPNEAGFLVAQIIKYSRDSDQLPDLIHTLLKTSDNRTAIDLFETILNQIGDDEDKLYWLKLQVAQAATYQPKMELMEPILELMDRFQNEKLFTSVLDSLIELLPVDRNSEEWKNANAIESLENDLLIRVKDRFETAERISSLANHAEKILNRNNKSKLHIKFFDLWQTGDVQKSLTNSEYNILFLGLYKAFEIHKNFVLKSGTKIEDDSLLSTEFNKLTTADYIDTTILKKYFSTTPRTDLIVAGEYQFYDKNLPLRLHLKIIDARDGIIYKVFKKKIDFGKIFITYEKNVNKVGQEIVDELMNELNAYLAFKIFAHEIPLEPNIVQKYRAYLFSGSKFSMHRTSLYDSLQGLVVQKIVIESDFFNTYENGKQFIPFTKALDKSLTEIYPEMLPIVLKTPQNIIDGNYLYIKGKSTQKKWSFDVQINRGYRNILQLSLTFDPDKTEDGKISDMQGKAAAAFTAEIIRSFLGSNQILFNDMIHKTKNVCKEISYYNAIPSILLPGSSQLIIANGLQSPHSQQIRKKGWLFMLSSSILAGCAIYYDQRAINRINNDDLYIRNCLIGSSCIVGAISAYLAYRDITKFKKEF